MSVPTGQSTAIDGAMQLDPPTRNASQSPPSDHLCCVYVHAGAGYHSFQNERIHLDACSDAAQMAMLILKSGGSAVDAAELAVKVLEDREITNAGYGSNLAMDGVVECDASIVDHFGRSGAVGAVAQIKNPVSLARLVLDHTMQTLTLRRVPPNLLVSQGATDFAIEIGVPILPHDALVSPAARERWVRWKSDLKVAERKARKDDNPPVGWRIRTIEPNASEVESIKQNMREQHTRNILGGYTNLSQSTSPPSYDYQMLDVEHQNHITESDPSGPSDPVSEGSTTSWPSEERDPTPDSLLSERVQEPPVVQPHTITESSRNAFINSTQKVPTLSKLKDYRALRDVTSDYIAEDTEMRDTRHDPKYDVRQSSTRKSYGDGSGDSDSESSGKTLKAPDARSIPTHAIDTLDAEALTETQLYMTQSTEKAARDPVSGTAPTLSALERPPLLPLSRDRDDDITDTVGAIAVDAWGNIACAASSGGIGMKYRGRVGPAALVGVGTAVMPINPDDPDRITVATVTSGTGEHIATTMAATVCAERLYQSVKKGKGGEYEEVTEDEALKAVIENEFMGHPSVRNSNSAGAIGILAIKKTRDGVFLYFGHNTDSFAMASMHSHESKPRVAMSRSNGNGSIAQGGRMLRYHGKKKKAPTGTR
ncbi:N-terminal nucleophile aminohydrolase [Lojkania enalia]|uniref:N-terminal nucleophile aminohydrolase n=1 Tax=Lojkania enalia TaxID=147567 RepID=A0A9P4KD55_9PLEO|nr:N-terminal nucleophile aminohydrolase [Didymosphaeria enalia]